MIKLKYNAIYKYITPNIDGFIYLRYLGVSNEEMHDRAVLSVFKGRTKYLYVRFQICEPLGGYTISTTETFKPTRSGFTFNRNSTFSVYYKNLDKYLEVTPYA